MADLTNAPLVVNYTPPETINEEVGQLLSNIAEAVEDELEARWVQGDNILRLCDMLGHMPAYRAAAGITKKSVRWSIELAKVARTFPDPVLRRRTEWPVFRVAANSADPEWYLMLALEHDLSAKELADRIRGNNP